MSDYTLPFQDAPEQQEVWRKHGQKNYRLGVYNGILFIAAESLLDPTLVLVAFISHLTQSPILLGLVVPLRDGVWALPQLWVSTFLQSLPIKIDLYRRLSIWRIGSWLALALTINFITQPALQLTLFFIVFTLASLASGLSGLSFLEVVSKTIPSRQRGQFFALRFGLGGMLGIFGSLFVRWMIDPAGPLDFPHNFGVLAFLYFVLASVSLVLYNNVVEPADPQVQPRVSFREQATRAWIMLRGNAAFQRYFTMQSALVLAGSATPFFAVFVQRELGGPTEMVGVYLGITMLFGLLGNLVFGRVSFIRGNRRVMLLAGGIGVLMDSLVLVLVYLAGPLGLTGLAASYTLIPVFILSSLRTTAMGVSSNSLLMDLAPQTDRSIYIGFYNSLIGLVMMVSGLSGVIIGLLGFKGLLFLALAAHVLALVTAIKISSHSG